MNFEVLQEGLAGGVGEGGALFGDAGLVEHLFGFEDGLFGGFENGVHAADDAHGEDDVGVFAALEEVAEDVVGDAPDEGDDFVVGGLVQYGGGSLSSLSVAGSRRCGSAGLRFRHERSSLADDLRELSIIDGRMMGWDEPQRPC